ncbi:MAG: hypothetical protein ACD_15C00111G0001 [uncultured bacterium]|nr:MAG: hypothetical protein ACD_15C00111G0001 [uncultured bacterium]
MGIKQKLVSPVLMWAIIILGIFAAFQIVPPRFVFPRNMLTPFLAIPAIGYWIYFFVGAIKVHRKAPLSADAIDRLVVEGVYGKVRHPIYSADIVLAWSAFFFYPDTKIFVSVLWLTLVMLIWMKIEEKALIEKFGREYEGYRLRVPKIFPKL